MKASNPFDRILAFTLVALALTVCVQAGQESTVGNVDHGMVERIRHEALERSQVAETLSYLADVCGPRLTGSPNIRSARAWCANRLRAWGLRNVHEESWGPFGRGWSLAGFSASMTAPSFSPILAYPKAWSPSTNGVVRGEPVYIDAKTPAELERFRGKLSGAIVLLSPPRELPSPFEPKAHRLSDSDLLALANATPSAAESNAPESPERRAQLDLAVARWRLVTDERAALVLQPGYGDRGTFFVTDATVPGPPGSAPDTWPKAWAASPGPVVPQAVVAAEHYGRMVRLIEKGIRVRIEAEIVSRFDDAPTDANLIAEIPGTDLADQVVMLGGCIDSWHAGTGATDNAAGAAVGMEAMRILQVLGARPRRTIRLALWSAEEQGSLGSRAYVAAHFGVLRPGSSGVERTKEYDRLSCYFNLDYGTGKLRGIYLQGNEAVRPIFRSWLAPLADLGASTLSVSDIGFTDHVPFDEVGLPAFQFIRDEIDYGTTQHTNMDVYERAQIADLQQAAAVACAIVYDAAMCEERLPRKVGPRLPRR